MTNYELFNIRQLLARHENVPSFGESLACFPARREDSHIPLNIPMTLDYVHICFFKKGSGAVCINTTDVELHAGDVLFCPANSFLEFKPYSRDFLKYTLAIDTNFIQGNAYLGAKLETMLTMMRITQQYVLKLTREESETVERCMLFLSDYITKPHPCKEALLQSICYSLMLEFMPAYKRNNYLAQDLSRQGVIMRDFYDLAQVHFREEHFLGFYASQLCISEQYLSLVVRDVTGRTVADIISSFMIIEAEKLLLKTRKPIKFVADQLSFRDTTNFCSYFKGKTGLSPSEYRKKYS